jgi:hypothetical protein
MRSLQYCALGFFLILTKTAIAGVDPISWKITSASMPPVTKIGNNYLINYTFTSNLPFPMPTPLMISTAATNSTEFIFRDTCSTLKLTPGQNCSVSIGFNPKNTGSKTAGLTMSYGGNIIPLPTLVTQTQSSKLDATWVGLIGVDYSPNHYASGNQFNGHDVFYTGTANGNAVSNTYIEMSQLKAAGFTAIRSYQTSAYSWIDIINQANSLGLNVIYEASIPYNGSSTDISNAVIVLNNVINAVGTTVFQNTVTLVLAGHENYSNTDISYLVNAVSQLQSALQTSSITVPVGSALVSGDIVTPGSVADMTALINSYSASAPLGFDPYPFQWGVTPPASAVSDITLTNSIGWDYAQVQAQKFYISPRPILMAETGWATSGTGQIPNYYCYTQNNCAPSVANAASYLTALYAYVQTPSNNSGALVFEAYNEPAKDSANPTDAENHYGMFDENCNLKNNNTNLLPNTSFSTTANLGCQGYVNGALFSVVGTQPGAITNQPPFTVSVTQTNPTTSQSASYSATIPNQNRTDASTYPWPQYLAFNNANITITGLTSGASCSVTATVSASTISFGSVNCTNPSYLVTCSGNNCFLPWNNF